MKRATRAARAARKAREFADWLAECTAAMPLFDVMLTARGEHLAQTRVCSLINREASALAEGLAPSESWPTDEPTPDLSLLWETSAAMRSRPRDRRADALNRMYGMYGSARR